MKNMKLWDEEVTLTQEDKFLISVVQQFNPGNWKKISLILQENFSLVRTAKQCRDRWFNNLKNNTSNRAFTDSEVSKILAMFEEYGPKWSEISKHLSDRSESQVKNFINAAVRRNVRRFNKGKFGSEKIPFSGAELLAIPKLRKILLSDKSKKRSWFNSQELDEETTEKIRDLHEKKLAKIRNRKIAVPVVNRENLCSNTMNYKDLNFLGLLASHLFGQTL